MGSGGTRGNPLASSVNTHQGFTHQRAGTKAPTPNFTMEMALRTLSAPVGLKPASAPAASMGGFLALTHPGPPSTLQLALNEFLLQLLADTASFRPMRKQPSSRVR